MRLLADENIQGPTIQFLKDRGLDVSSIGELERHGASDDRVFDVAQHEKRVLLTWNEDFSDIRDYTGREHCGIIRLRITNQRISNVNHILERVFTDLRTMDLRNTLVTVTDHRVRIRKTST